MLDNVLMPQADSGVVTALLQPVQRRRRGLSTVAAKAEAIAEAATTVTRRSTPTTEKMTRGSIAILLQGQWLNDEVVNFVGRILIALSRESFSSRAHVYSPYLMRKLLSGGSSVRITTFRKSEILTTELKED